MVRDIFQNDDVRRVLTSILEPEPYDEVMVINCVCICVEVYMYVCVNV